MIDKILNELENLIPHPVCELEFNKDYELLIAVMLSAQTTDKRVNIVTKKLFSKYDSLEKLEKAPLKEVEQIIYSLGSYTKKSKAIIEIAKKVKSWGSVPNDRKLLESLPMVGRKTVSVVLSELFKEPNIAVDTHVERVSKRLGLARNNANVLEVEKSLKRKIPKKLWCETHLRLVYFGRYYCTAKNPNCDNCNLKDICKYKK
ncbi:MAG: endonuclease III [Bacilli bacterium]